MKHGKPTGNVCHACRLAQQRQARATEAGRNATNLASRHYYAKNGAAQRFRAASTMQCCPQQSKAQRRWWAALGQATPAWLTNEHWDQMNALYNESYQLGRHMSVDHIVPLIGVDTEGNHIVCGLNVPWNLQVIPNGVNARKGRYFYQV